MNATQNPASEGLAALRLLLADADRATVWRLASTAVLVATSGLLAGAAPLALKGMIDSASARTEHHGGAIAAPMLLLAAAYLVSLCVTRFLTELRPVLMSAAEQRLHAGLRARYHRHLLALPLAFHLDRRTGAAVQCLHQGVAGYQIMSSALLNTLLPVVVELSTVIWGLYTLGQPKLVATFAGSALAYLAVSARKSGLQASARAVSDASVVAHGTLADGLLNVETVKCFGAEGATHKRLVRAVTILEERWASLQRVRWGIGLATSTTFSLSMAASLAIAIHAVGTGQLSVGGFVLANVYMLQVMRPLEMLGAAARDVAQAIEFIRPLMVVFAEPIEAEPLGRLLGPGADGVFNKGPSADTAGSAATTSIHKLGASIRFEAVRFSYVKGNPVLRDFSLRISAGQKVGIVGASGSGKSSLVRLLYRLYEPQSGSILMDDAAIHTLPAADLRSRIALVPQDTALFDESIAFNIAVGRSGATRSDIEHAAGLARLHDFISALPRGYDTIVGERGLKLSGGERQRVAIARAVLKDPQVFVFDEATSMLDSATERAILGNLEEISAGRTTITIAHRLSTIRCADEIVVLERGQVVEQGSHADLMGKGGSYATMWRSQQSAT